MAAKWRAWLMVVFMAGAWGYSPLSYVTAQTPDTGPYRLQQTLGRGMVRSVAWSPDGDVIAVGGALGIWLYTPELEDIGLLKGHSKAVYGLAFSPDGTRLASASHDMTVRIWDVETQSELHTMTGHTGLTVAVAWSPDGSMAASGAYDHTVRVWNADTGDLIRVLEGHTGWVDAVAFSPDGRLLASGGYDDVVRIWDVATGEERLVLEGLTSPVTGVTWYADGRRVMGEAREGGRSESTDWDAETGETSALLKTLIQQSGGPADREAMSGDYWATLDWDETIKVWGKDGLLASQPEHVDWLTAVKWEGTEIVTAASDGNLRTWDSATGEFMELSPGTFDPIPLPAVSPDGTQTLALDDDGIVHILDTATGDVIAELPGLANAAAWSPDGVLVAVALRNGTVQIWKAE